MQNIRNCTTSSKEQNKRFRSVCFTHTFVWLKSKNIECGDKKFYTFTYILYKQKYKKFVPTLFLNGIQMKHM